MNTLFNLGLIVSDNDLLEVFILAFVAVILLLFLVRVFGKN